MVPSHFRPACSRQHGWTCTALHRLLGGLDVSACRSSARSSATRRCDTGPMRAWRPPAACRAAQCAGCEFPHFLIVNLTVRVVFQSCVALKRSLRMVSGKSRKKPRTTFKRVFGDNTISPKIITVLTRYRPYCFGIN